MDNFFYFSPRERNGTIIMSIISIILLLLPEVIPLFMEPRWNDREAESILRAVQNISFNSAHKKEPIAMQLFPFDPNKADSADLLKLGLPENTVRTIVNYRNKGGRFFNPADMKKIFTLSDSDFLRIKPYIHISASEKPTYAKDIEKIQPEKEIPVRLDYFDPNVADQATLRSLGLSEKVVKTLLNYRENGGKFFQKSDLLKIYGLQQEEFNQLEPYISIATSGPTFAQNNVAVKKTKLSITIDVNSANEEMWQQLHGIGPSYARRIIEYRNKLGGFVELKQLLEVYRLPDSTFQSILPHLTLSPIFKGIRINTATEEELKTHPYIQLKQARAIINYRTHHGPLLSFEDFSKLYVFSEEEKQRIKPYIIFD